MTRAVVALCAALAACTPVRHRVAPYDRDAAAASRLEAVAACRCEARHGGAAIPPRPFKTDGCTLWPDGRWLQCCVAHDMAYWCGGTRRHERRAADAALRDCVRRSGSRLGTPMLIAVRIAGVSWLPAPWRWGYGWTWPVAGVETEGRARGSP